MNLLGKYLKSIFFSYCQIYDFVGDDVASSTLSLRMKLIFTPLFFSP